jgi:ribonuclease HI
MTTPASHSVAPERAIFHFDGGCRPNPGPMHAAVVSRGRVWFHDDLGQGDNNEAEWSALLLATAQAAAQACPHIVLIGDSALVVAQASGRQPCRSAHLRPYLDRFREAAAAFSHVHVRHVPRTKNLAGIALARRDLLPWTATDTARQDPPSQR